MIFLGSRVTGPECLFCLEYQGVGLCNSLSEKEHLV